MQFVNKENCRSNAEKMMALLIYEKWLVLMAGVEMWNDAKKKLTPSPKIKNNDKYGFVEPN
jgi:hypothetical protein